MNPYKLMMLAQAENGSLPKLVRAVHMHTMNNGNTSPVSKAFSVPDKKDQDDNCYTITNRIVIGFGPIECTPSESVYRVPTNSDAVVGKCYVAPKSRTQSDVLVVVCVTETNVPYDPDMEPPLWLVAPVNISAYNRIVDSENSNAEWLLSLHKKAAARKQLVEQLDSFEVGSKEREDILNLLLIQDPAPGYLVPGVVQTCASMDELLYDTPPAPPFAQPPMAPPPMAPGIPPTVSAPWVGQPHGNFDKDDKNVDINKL